MDWLKKHWGTISTLLGGALTFILPSIQAYAAAHPKTSMGVVMGCVIGAYNLTAPKDKPKEN